MIFQHTWQAVLEGRKTQTRRIVIPRTIEPRFYDWKTQTWEDSTGETDGDWLKGETVWHAKPTRKGEGFCGLGYTKAVVKYQVGKTYAVQPARGQKAIARIRITSIRREDVRNISLADVEAEGFIDSPFFFETWCSMHDPKLKVSFYDCLHWSIGGVHYEGWTDDLLKVLADRPVQLYDAWVLGFELVEE